MTKLGLTMLGILSLAACSTASTPASPLIADKAIQLTAGTAVKLSTVAAAAAVAGGVYLIYDPFAANWDIEESMVNDQTYRLSLTMKRFHTGGAGESLQVLKRRASQLQHEKGFAGYQILEYTEGIESRTIGSRRVADGVVRLVQRLEADSFSMNENY